MREIYSVFIFEFTHFPNIWREGKKILRKININPLYVLVLEDFLLSTKPMTLNALKCCQMLLKFS